MMVSVDLNGPPSVSTITGADISIASFRAMNIVIASIVFIAGVSIWKSILADPAPSISAASIMLLSIDRKDEMRRM